ncbi:flavin oxidoreductase [Vibrio coralliilyticus OCN008]|uniref:flavin reductase family protein n=1 Tax=Vibrio coralliilyticus TaxID=190893 RepID=UPI0003912AB5|nr:flavin reductase [Vibrio coralliilyticus]ERB66105.1 flavin oxidoreductase [Vibrio coralliilyticus OCN008]QIJ86967.1 flavin oxidoreductase [Vibrio coralliilyticus OCN008]
MKDKNFTKSQITAMDERKRARLINSLSGFKSANLIGTQDKFGNNNLAIVSSVVHIGSSPPLLGFVSRPNTVDRHTLENVLQSGFFSINSVESDIARAAHQTSARYSRAQSEFDETGLTPYFSERFPAPYVLESNLKIGLKLSEYIDITANNTCLIIGEVEEILIPDQFIQPDGYVDIESMEAVTISGLDSYHVTQRLYRLSYAKPDLSLHPLTLEGDPSSWAALKSETD